jgi:hypothetical protein
LPVNFAAANLLPSKYQAFFPEAVAGTFELPVRSSTSEIA